MTVRNFDPLASSYDATRGGEKHGAKSAERVARHLPPSGRLLELGVGTGLVAAALRRPVVGVDISAAMLGRARERIGSAVVRADALRLPFPPATFDAGYAVWLLHLVDDKPALFAEVARVLKPRSVFVVEPAAVLVDDEIQTIGRELFQAVLGDGFRSDAPDRLASAAEPAGVELVAVEEYTDTLTQSPLQVVEFIERRTGSAFHGLSDAQWAALVEPHLDRLRDLPAPEQPRQSTAVERVLVFRTP